LLHVRFRFVESSIYVEEKRKSELGELQQLIPIVKSVEDEGHCWCLGSGNYRAYGLPLSLLAASTEVLTRQSHTFTVNMPNTNQTVLHTPPRQVFSVLPRSEFL